MDNTENIKDKALAFDKYGSLLALTNWMEFFGFFYYIVCGMLAFGSVLVLVIGLISSGAHTLMLIMISVILIVYCILSIYLGSNLFKSSNNFREAIKSDEINRYQLISGFDKLKRFFWFYGGLIVLNLIWLAFL